MTANSLEQQARELVLSVCPGQFVVDLGSSKLTVQYDVEELCDLHACWKPKK
jgi:hypothetical protein